MKLTLYEIPKLLDEAKLETLEEPRNDVFVYFEIHRVDGTKLGPDNFLFFRPLSDSSLHRADVKVCIVK